MRMTQVMRWMLCGLVSVLTGCANQASDDLTQWMQQSDHLVAMAIEPLPEVQAFVPKPYNADGSLQDPFVPHKAQLPDMALQPDMQRRREPLEAYPLEGLRFVGVVSRKQKIFATVQTTDQQVFQVKPGNYIGEHFGLITALNLNPKTQHYEMHVKETVQDPTSGEWAVHMTTLELQDKE